MLRLHLGCGKRYMTGYEHVDLADFGHIDYRHDIKKLPKYEDNSVDEIYCSHALEYYDVLEVYEVLKEWRRVLKPGAVLRLAVPDFKALMEVYLETGNIELITGPIYGRWPINNNLTVYHKIGYDEKSLTKLLRETGFEQVRKWNWKEIFVGNLEGYDDYSKAYYPHMTFESGKLMSLNLQCYKGGFDG